MSTMPLAPLQNIVCGSLDVAVWSTFTTLDHFRRPLFRYVTVTDRYKTVQDHHMVRYDRYTHSSTGYSGIWLGVKDV